MALTNPQPRCLFFDVFGTCVDWRTTVTNALWQATRDALNSPAASIASRIRFKASDMTYEQWGDIAQEWRESYHAFTRALANDPAAPWKSVDEHHHDALRDILVRHGLVMPREHSADIPPDLVQDGSLWDAEEIRGLALVWHRLDPWPDTTRGIQELNRLYWTSSLTNGNLALIRDMAVHARMDFTHIFSAEMFGSYKPNPKVYLGAAEKLGIQPNECVLVAAHLDDLQAAKRCGFRTVYVERPREEKYPELLGGKDAFVDVHVTADEDGFVAVAEKLGILVDRQRRRSTSAPARTTDPANVPS